MTRNIENIFYREKTRIGYTNDIDDDYELKIKLYTFLIMDNAQENKANVFQLYSGFRISLKPHSI